MYRSSQELNISGLNILVELLSDNHKMIKNFIPAISDEQFQKHDLGNSTIKEILVLMIEYEQLVIQLLILKFSPNQGTQKIEDYKGQLSHTPANERSVPSILHEYSLTRNTLLNLIRSLMNRFIIPIQPGKISCNHTFVRELLKSLIDHELKHFRLIKEKYVITGKSFA